MRGPVIAALALTSALLSAASVAAQDAVRLYAAGSLRAPLTAIADRGAGWKNTDLVDLPRRLHLGGERAFLLWSASQRP